MLILKKLTDKLLASLSIVLTVVIGVFAIRSNHKAKNEAKSKVEAAERKVKEVEAVAAKQAEVVKEVRNVENKVAASSDDAVLDELQSDWSRD